MKLRKTLKFRAVLWSFCFVFGFSLMGCSVILKPKAHFRNDCGRYYLPVAFDAVFLISAGFAAPILLASSRVPISEGGTYFFPDQKSELAMGLVAISVGLSAFGSGIYGISNISKCHVRRKKLEILARRRKSRPQYRRRVTIGSALLALGAIYLGYKASKSVIKRTQRSYKRSVSPSCYRILKIERRSIRTSWDTVYFRCKGRRETLRLVRYKEDIEWKKMTFVRGTGTKYGSVMVSAVKKRCRCY